VNGPLRSGFFDSGGDATRGTINGRWGSIRLRPSRRTPLKGQVTGGTRLAGRLVPNFLCSGKRWGEFPLRSSVLFFPSRWFPNLFFFFPPFSISDIGGNSLVARNFQGRFSLAQTPLAPHVCRFLHLRAKNGDRTKHHPAGSNLTVGQSDAGWARHQGGAWRRCRSPIVQQTGAAVRFLGTGSKFGPTDAQLWPRGETGADGGIFLPAQFQGPPNGGFNLPGHSAGNERCASAWSGIFPKLLGTRHSVLRPAAAAHGCLP